MSLKRSEAAPLDKVTASGTANLARFVPDNTSNLGEVQSAFIAARFRLDAPRARVVAELAWGRP